MSPRQAKQGDAVGMSDRASPILGPAIDRSGRITGFGKLLGLASGLVGISIGLALIRPDQAQPLVLGLLAMLAVVGIAALLAGAIGVIRFSIRVEGDELGKALLDATGDGVLITDRDPRIVYANRTYAELTGTSESGDIRSVERAFARYPQAAEVIYRIAQRLREGMAS